MLRTDVVIVKSNSLLFAVSKDACHSVGIFVNENLKPKKVRIRAFKPYDSYIKSLPLHHSQVEIKDDNKDYADFKLDVCLI